MQNGNNIKKRISIFLADSNQLLSGCTSTRLPWQYKSLRNTSVLIKTYVTVILAQPTLINSSATQSQGAAIFPKKLIPRGRIPRGDWLSAVWYPMETDSPWGDFIKIWSNDSVGYDMIYKISNNSAKTYWKNWRSKISLDCPIKRSILRDYFEAFFPCKL